MSKIFDELAMKAGMTGNHQVWFTRPELMKMAELVAIECARTASMVSIDKTKIHPDLSWDEMSMSAQIAGHAACQVVAAEIRDHFGID